MARPADPELSRTIDALARTIAPSAARLGVLATIRPAVIAEPHAVDSARPRSLGATLPHLDVAIHESGKPTAAAELELTSILGRGGMGAVWLARQRSLARDVAIKRLAGEASVDDAAALLVEARATGALEHPSIVPVHALGVAGDGFPLLVMKRIDGTSLKTLVETPDHSSWPALERRHGDRLGAYLEILSRVADALELAHARGFIHRDVKPANIMVGTFGETYLLDWGIALSPALLSAAERERIAIVGTPAYMAPEMVQGRPAAIDARTDVYLLGGTLHTVLTGKPRHEGETLHAVLLAAMMSTPVDYAPEVPGELAALARRATAHAPENRLPDVAAFREAIAEFRRHRGSMTITREVEEKLASISSAPDKEELVSIETSRTLTEARFGLAHALSQWPSNEVARVALVRTQRLLVLVELARGSHETAAALLRDMDSPDAALAAQVEALRGQKGDRDKLADQALADAVDRDPGVRGSARALFALSLTFVSVGVGVAYFLATGDTSDTLTESLASDAFQLGVVAIVVGLFRRRLLANRWSRRAIGLLFIAGALLLVSTIMGIVAGETEVDASVRNLVFATVFATSAPDLSPRLWIAAAWAAVAALLCVATPAQGPWLTMISMLCGVSVLVSESIRPTTKK